MERRKEKSDGSLSLSNWEDGEAGGQQSIVRVEPEAAHGPGSNGRKHE